MTAPRRCLVPLLLCLLASGMLEGCFLFRRGVYELPVEVRIASDANDDSPVPVSFVLVHDPALLPELSKLTASQWLKMREQYLRDHAGAVQEKYFELVPGPSIQSLSLPVRGRSVGGLLFIGYQTEGPNRYPFDPRQPLWLELGRQEAHVVQR